MPRTKKEQVVFNGTGRRKSSIARVRIMSGKGKSHLVDIAIEKHQPIEEFLIQEEYEPSTIPQMLKKLSELTGIEIPEEEYVESPSIMIPTTAQITDAQAKMTEEI